MHEYTRFVHTEMSARGWRQVDLVRRSGLSRQVISKILRDTRPTLGQMPDEATLEGLARGFDVPVELVRLAASRALAGYVDDHAVKADLRAISNAALLSEIRRRMRD